MDINLHRHKKKVRRFWIVGVVLITAILVLVLLVLQPPTRCYGFSGLMENPAGADIGAATFCGSVIWTKNQLILPFKSGSNGLIDFCLKNSENVQKSCGIRVDEIVLEDELYKYDYYFTCKYLILNSTDGRQKDIITITNFFANVGGVYKNVITAREWHSTHSDLSYGICNYLEQNINR